MHFVIATNKTFKYVRSTNSERALQFVMNWLILCIQLCVFNFPYNMCLSLTNNTLRFSQPVKLR